MSNRSVEHATFTVERTYDAAPSRVFAAWAEREAKARWFKGTDEAPDEYELDFRVGGREINRGAGPDGQQYTYEARYADIVPDERIVYSYDMYRDETRISVLLATIELEPDGRGTKLTFTEQGAFLDGEDKPVYREQGTGGLLDALGAELERITASA
jgi:uncharacterized protein YndB with AHSA1/START domain